MVECAPQKLITKQGGHCASFLAMLRLLHSYKQRTAQETCIQSIRKMQAESMTQSIALSQIHSLHCQRKEKKDKGVLRSIKVSP